MRTTTAAAAALIIIRTLDAGSAHAADPRHPDWPCHQIEVPTLSVAAFWTGPSIDDVGDTWRNDATVFDGDGEGIEVEP